MDEMHIIAIWSQSYKINLFLKRGLISTELLDGVLPN
jgi:hypothetical protein